MVVVDSPIVIVDMRLTEIEHQIGRDLSDIGERVMSIGQHLTEARALITPDNWTNWVKSKSDTKQWTMSIRTAQNMIRTYETFKDRDFEPGQFTATALYALAYSGDDGLIDDAIEMSTDQTVNKQTVKLLQTASPTIKERYLKRELNEKQATQLASAVKKIGSVRVKKLAEEKMTDGAAALKLDQVSKYDPDIVDVAEAAGCVYVGENEVVKLEDLTERDLTRHQRDIEDEQRKQKFAEQFQMVINGREALVESVDHARGQLILIFRGDLEDIVVGETLRVSVERINRQTG